MNNHFNEMNPFTFSVVAHPSRVPASDHSLAYLIEDNWDDWSSFRTLFNLIVFDDKGNRHEIGYVKIGQFGLKKAPSLAQGKGYRSPTLPSQFESLDETFFSLGQDDSYYEKLNKLKDKLRNQILAALNDVAANIDLFEKALKEPVMQDSLMRSINPGTVRGQFRRMAQGGARLSHYKFTYKTPRRVGSRQPPLVLNFEVEPESNPPANIHVLIGRNGVGKTYLLDLMARALVEVDASPKSVGTFVSDVPDSNTDLFANLVSVTFSAFDPFEPLPERRDRTDSMRYSYIGLKRASSTGSGIGEPKSPDILSREFVKSAGMCQRGARLTRWLRAVAMLEADPIFQEANVAALASNSVGDEFEKRATSLFGRLSSGHKIVLLTITRLVETVEERTLILLDEPEAHLHPPLLSAFVRTLSDLLINRNGVAVIATHSPVVLQEVPKRCVWKLRRTGSVASAERPDIETFGENVGVLTREVFGLEVTQAGFHKLLQDAVTEKRYFEEILGHFNGELGAEARAIVRTLIAASDSESQS